MTQFNGWTRVQTTDGSNPAVGGIETPVINKNNGFFCCTSDSGVSVETDGGFVAVIGTHPCREDLMEVWERYRQGKDDLCESLRGGFVLVLADYTRESLTLALDPIGQKSVYYAQTESGLVFGSSASAVAAHPQVSDAISAQMIYNYVYFHQCPSPGTIYTDVHKLEGGQRLDFQQSVSLRYYWQPTFEESGEFRFETASEQLHQELLVAVRDSVVDIGTTGAFLSGGLDSSSVVGTIARAFPGQVKSFSMGFDVEGYDEIEFARTAVQQFGAEQFEYYVTPDDTVSAVPAIAAYYDEPFGNSSALAAYYCARLARDSGVTTLLAGDGGDELFAGNERYAKQLLFERYYSVPALLRSGLRYGLYNLPDFMLKNRILFKGKRYVEQAEVPLPDRLEDYNFLHRHPAAEIFEQDFVMGIDSGVPLQGLRESFNRPPKAGKLNRMLFMDWKTTLHDNDLVKVNRMCEMNGVEVKYPLLNRNMVEFSCTVPSAQKLKDGELRWFYRQAMHGFLPDRIINKSKHGFGLPFGIWLKDHQPLKELAYDSLTSLKKRDCFRSSFLDHAIEMHQSVHAAFYGELIWVLMMLELWFQGKNR